MSKKQKAPTKISLNALLKRASREPLLFKGLMRNPEATLAREGLKLSDEGVEKLKRMKVILRGRVHLKISSGDVVKVFKQLSFPLNGLWSPDWPNEWMAKRFPPAGIPGAFKFPKSLLK